jgi:hypothetical protein
MDSMAPPRPLRVRHRKTQRRQARDRTASSAIAWRSPRFATKHLVVHLDGSKAPVQRVAYGDVIEHLRSTVM